MTRGILEEASWGRAQVNRTWRQVSVEVAEPDPGEDGLET